MKRFFLLLALLSGIYHNNKLAAQGSQFMLKANLAPIHYFPLWVTYLLTVLLVIVSIYAGFYYSSGKQKKQQEEQGPIGSVVGAMLGLLAFILAFTFGVTSSRLDTRKQLILDEANAIHSLYLRASQLPATQQKEVKELVRQYALLRKEITEHPENLDQYISSSKEIQQKLWEHAALLANTPLLHSDVLSLYTEALDRVTQLQTERITVALVHHLPTVIWLVLYLLTILSMAGLGYQFGLDQKPNRGLFLILSLGFSAVMMLIVDLDGFGLSKNSLIQVSQQPILDLLERINH